MQPVRELPELDECACRFRLDGRIVAITGAAGGIGRALVAGFAEAGARVIALDRYSPALSGVDPGTATEISLDVTDDTAVDGVFGQIGDVFERIDVLVNNAGVFYRGPTLDMPMAEWERVIDVN